MAISNTFSSIFRFLKLDGLPIEEKANKFYDLIVSPDDIGSGREWIESQLIEFFTWL